MMKPTWRPRGARTHLRCPAAVDAFERRGAGADLEQPELLLGQRWLLVGVVLLAREQTPNKHASLQAAATTATWVAAAGADPLVEGVHRPSLGSPAR